MRLTFSVRRRLLAGVLLPLLGVAAAPALTVEGSATGLQAQTTTGSIRGYVRDEAGAPAPNTTVTARNVAMGTSRSTTTNENGFYNIPGLRPDRYAVDVRRIGLTPQTRNVTVQIGQTIDLNFSLTSSAVQLTTVQVTAVAPSAETRTSEVATNVSREQIQNLPVIDRNFLDFAKLAPGITATQPNNSDKFISAGGRPAEAVNVFVDGATYKNDILRGGVVGQDASKGNPFPQGAVQEFRVITQNYKAEYQKASSAIVTATTRSGGNRWEGDLFGFGIAPAYVARDAIAVQRGNARPNYKRLQAGGSLGGPIAKDKLFFFGTYELNARNEPAYVSLGSRASEAPASFNFQRYVGQFQTEFREHLGFGKVTYVPSDRNTIEGSANIRRETDFRGFSGQTTTESAENLKVDVYTGVLNWKYAGDRWLNEAQMNGQHFVWNPTPVNPTLVGRNYQDVLRLGGRDTRQDFSQNRLSLRDDITRSGVRLGGDHVFKGGVTTDFLTYDVRKYFVSNPVFQYNLVNNFSQPVSVDLGFGNPQMNTSNVQFGAYVQDDWTPIQKLVLNLGLRWDAETNMANNSFVTPTNLRDSLLAMNSAGTLTLDQPVLKSDGTCCDVRTRNVINELGGISNFITSGRSDRPIYKKAFQPRVGASYDFFGNGRTVVFAGYGVYYDRNYWNTLIDEQFRRQYNLKFGQPINDVGPTAECPNCIAWDPNFLTNPALLRQQLQVQSTEVFLVKNDLKPPRSNQYSAGLRQGVGPTMITLSYNGVRGFNGTNFIRGANNVGPAYAALFITDDRVKTRYDALQLQVEKPLQTSTRWGGSLSYTLSRSEEQGQSTDLFWGFNDKYPTVAELPWRRAPGNQTHSIVANAIVRLPYEVLFSTLMSFGSGIAETRTDASEGYGFGVERPYVYQPPTRPFLGLGHVFTTQNLDARAEKDFRLASAQSIALIVDVFNVFGVKNYGCYNGDIAPLSGPPNANYNRPDCAGLGRRLQLGLRYGLQPRVASGNAR